jgi:hypothetical protein
MNKKVIHAIFDDEEILLQSVKEIKSKKYDIEEVYSPFPVHGLDHALGLKETRMAITAFIYGCIGLSFGGLLIYYIMISGVGKSWPMNIGGKPNFSLKENMLSFVPIFFEFTVLCAAHGMAITYLIRNKTLPGMPPRNPDPRTTDDKFVMEIKTSDNAHVSEKDLSKLIKDTGFIEIEEKSIL